MRPNSTSPRVRTSAAHRVTRRTAAVLAGFVLVAACGPSGGETDGTTTTTSEPPVRVESGDVDTTSTTAPRSGDSVRSVVQSVDGDLTLEVVSTAAEIWATTNRDDICSPVEPAVAVFEAALDGPSADDVVGMRAFFVRDAAAEVEGEAGPADATSTTELATTTTTVDGSDSSAATTTTTEPSGQTRTVDFAVDDDDVWRAVVGPIRATNRNDRPLDVTVVAQTDDGERTETELALTVLAPVPCGTGERPGGTSRTPDAVALTVSTDPPSAVIVGAEQPDCEGRPTRLTIAVESSGAVVSMTARGTLPDGTSILRSFEGRGGRDFSVQLGPFPSPPSGEAVTARFTVSATDVFGTTVERSVSATLVRPEPCGDSEATTTTIDGDGDGAELAVSFDPAPPLVHSSGQGQCPTGPTTLAISFTGPSAITAVSVTTRTANGQTATTSLVESGGSWRGTLGPFAGWNGMATTSDLGVRITATASGGTRTLDETARLRRAEPCGSGSTTPTTTASTTTSPPAGSGTTTTTSPPTGSTTTSTTTTTTTSSTTTTTTTTTTTVAPPPPAITNAGANPNPVACGAQVTIGVQTSGVVTQVGASVGGGVQALSGGGGTWTRSITAPGSRQQLNVTVRAEGPAGSDQRSFTLNVDC